MNNAVQQFINKGKESAELYKNIIERMLNDTDEYEYAEETLCGILDFINVEGRITEKQMEAVDNIKDKPSICNGCVGEGDGYEYK